MQNKDSGKEHSGNETKSLSSRIFSLWLFCIKRPFAGAFRLGGILAFLYIVFFTNFAFLSMKSDHHSPNSAANQSLFYRIFPKKPVIAVLRLYGEIGMGRGLLSLDSIGDDIDRTFATKDLSAVCIVINSPGGSGVQSHLIASRIISLSQKHKVPVYSFVEDVGASGGYWLACAGDKIFASSGSIVGSIGVIYRGFGLVETAKKLGIERRIYAQGKNKGGIDQFLPVDPDKIAKINDIGMKMHNVFIEYVRSRRGDRLDAAGTVELFDGSFWVGNDAVKLGLIDGIQSLHDFVDAEFGKEAFIKFIKKKESLIKRTFGVESIIDDIANCVRSSIEELFISKWF
jgi:signal peptide peptidase SppA